MTLITELNVKKIAGQLNDREHVAVHEDGAQDSVQVDIKDLVAGGIGLAGSRDAAADPAFADDRVGTIRKIGVDENGNPIWEFRKLNLVDITPTLAVVSTNPPQNGLMTPEDKALLEANTGQINIDGGRADSVYLPSQVIDGGGA